MAFLFIAKNFFNSIPTNTFKKASTNSEIIIGGVGKCVFENKLIGYEAMTYSICLSIAHQDALANGMLILGAIGSGIIPILRLLKSWENKNIDIINCEYPKNQSN
jgi:hypothetical protein